MKTALDEQLPPPEIDPFSRALSGLIPGIALIAAVSVAMVPFRDHLGAGASAIVLLVPVLVATIGGVWVALVVALLGATTLNYFFTAPYETLRISSAEDIAAVVAYVGVAVLVAIALSRRRDAVQLAGRRGRDQRFVLASLDELTQGDDLDDAVAHILTGLLVAAHLRGAAVRAGGIDEVAGAPFEGGLHVGVLAVDPGPEPFEGDRLRLVEEIAGALALALSSPWRAGARPPA